MSQSRKHSLLEVIASTTAGYFIAIITQRIVFPLYGMHVDAGENYQIALIFTLVSIVRGYVFRRLFNWMNRL